MTHDRKHRTRKTVRTVLSIFALITLMCAAPAAAQTGICVQAFIDESIVLPDGSVHPPGVLRLCLEQQYSPVAGLHETSIDGRTIGLFISRYRLSEGVTEDPRAKLVFRRIPDGGLTLLGYAVPGRERTAIYWMESADRARRRARVEPVPVDLAGLTETEADGIELIVAALR